MCFEFCARPVRAVHPPALMISSATETVGMTPAEDAVEHVPTLVEVKVTHGKSAPKKIAFYMDLKSGGNPFHLN